MDRTDRTVFNTLILAMDILTVYSCYSVFLVSVSFFIYALKHYSPSFCVWKHCSQNSLLLRRPTWVWSKMMPNMSEIDTRQILCFPFFCYLSLSCLKMYQSHLYLFHVLFFLLSVIHPQPQVLPLNSSWWVPFSAALTFQFPSPPTLSLHCITILFHLLFSILLFSCLFGCLSASDPGSVPQGMLSGFRWI